MAETRAEFSSIKSQLEAMVALMVQRDDCGGGDRYGTAEHGECTACVVYPAVSCSMQSKCFFIEASTRIEQFSILFKEKLLPSESQCAAAADYLSGCCIARPKRTPDEQ